MIDSICTCNHWHEEHGHGGCYAPGCDCQSFTHSEEASGPDAVADRGGDPEQWPQRVKDAIAL